MNFLSTLDKAQLVGALLLFSLDPSRAEVWQSKELNCVIKLPDENGWTRVPPPAAMVKVSIRSPDRTKVLSVYVSAADQSLSAERFLERFKKTWFEHGTSKGKSDEKTEVSGRLAYRLKDTAILGGKELYRANTIVMDAGRLYQIDALGVGSDPLADPVVRDCVASFQLFSQVGSPIAKASASDPADKLPERIGNITFYVMVGIAGLFIVVKLVRGRDEQRSGKISIAR